MDIQKIEQSLANVKNSSGWWGYLIAILLLTLIMRVLIGLMKSFEYRFSWDEDAKEFFTRYSYWQRFWILFAGASEKDLKPDLWYNTIIGTFELAIFPFLMKANAWEAIGAWIGLKALSQWEVWSKRRLIFNRFLIANILLLVLSFMITLVLLG
jgi:hypothetical protein